MNGPSRTDEVLALLNKRERGEGQNNAPKAEDEDALGFTDFLPSPAAAVLNKLQRVSAQPRSDQPSLTGRTPSDALMVVLGEQQPTEPRKLRCVPVLELTYCMLLLQVCVLVTIPLPSRMIVFNCIKLTSFLVLTLQAINSQLQEEAVWP